MSNDLLFELGSEELPSGAVELLANALADNLVNALLKANLAHGTVRCFATPRRLAVLILDVQMEQKSVSVTRRGPVATLSREEPAVMGFAKSCGVSVDELTTNTTDKGSWWVYDSIKPGANTRDLIPALILEATSILPIAKPMRWGAGDTLFARPVHWAVLLLGDEVVPMDVLGVKTNRFSVGHRYHHPQPFMITSPQSYESALGDRCVIADFNKRRENIITQVQELATRNGHVALMPDALVDEVTSIVEWPNALLVDFEAQFLDVPAEALIAAMQSHQKCFALRNHQSHLVPQFITVCNIASSDPKHVIFGNERVMRARLSDAAFFFRQDKKQALSHYAEATKTVVFQQKLGTLADKAVRNEALILNIAPTLNLDLTQAVRAAQLSKCDLMTGMVGEFPELQGLMGYYYARIDGEDDAVACALNEQYMPRFAADALPQSDLGRALSLVDRLDTLVGTFAIGQKPTGVKDPFKLRRHALAVVRLLIALPASIKLSSLIDSAWDTYGNTLPAAELALADLRLFILDRLQSFYHGQGISVDVVNAVRAREDEWLYDLNKRVHALLAFIQLPDAQALAAACKRVNNILQHASSSVSHLPIDATLLTDGAEKALFQHIQSVEDEVAPYYLSGDYGYILSQLASLREPLDAFFEHVMVMVDDEVLRDNRLRLLLRLQQLLQGVADISLLQSAS